MIDSILRVSNAGEHGGDVSKRLAADTEALLGAWSE